MMLDGSDGIARRIAEDVRALYECHPYPGYPLAATPRPLEGYLASSRFARSLISGSRIQEETRQSASNTLILGCGEFSPCVLSAMENGFGRKVTGIDLSAPSVRRARLRQWIKPLSQRPRLIVGDLETCLGDSSLGHDSFDHLDAYGVLHHLARPRQAIRQIADLMPTGGTIRLMVYNSIARRWISHIRKAFRLLRLSPLVRDDLDESMAIITWLRQSSKDLNAHLNAIGEGTLNHRARFADLFLNRREVPLSIEEWLWAFEKSDLTLVGLFDRYCELDDLANPLWSPPSSSQLSERALDGRFENNLELILVKGGGSIDKTRPAQRNEYLRTQVTTLKNDTAIPKTSADPSPWLQMRRIQESLSNFGHRLAWKYPGYWTQYEETAGLGRPYLGRLWQWHRDFHKRGYTVSAQDQVRFADHFLSGIEPRPAQRLARIGAILPSFLEQARWETLIAPMENSMAPGTRIKEGPGRKGARAMLLSPASPVARRLEEISASNMRRETVLARLARVL